MAARHVFDTMGTTVSIHADAPLSGDLLAAVEAVFAVSDARFSLYRPGSEMSRVADRSLSLLDASAELRDVYGQALDWRTRTRGAFTPHRPDGVIDLSGIVKALAIRDAGAVLDATGAEWMLGCGGDILTRSGTGATPVIGIADPADGSRLLTSLALHSRRRAVATSGVSERGEHVWGPRTDYDQVTVVADDIVTADVLATAILAGGRATLQEALSRGDCDVLIVGRDGAAAASRGFAGGCLPLP